MGVSGIAGRRVLRPKGNAIGSEKSKVAVAARTAAIRKTGCETGLATSAGRPRQHPSRRPIGANETISMLLPERCFL